MDLVVLVPSGTTAAVKPDFAAHFEVISITREGAAPYPRLRRISPAIARVCYAISPYYGFHEMHSVASRVRQIIERGCYDHIVIRYLSTFGHCGLRGLPNVIVDIDDLPAQAFGMKLVGSEHNLLRRAFLKLRTRGIDKYTRRLAHACKHVWLANPQQASLFKHASCLPNIPYPFIDRMPGPAHAARSARVIFVGAMDYLPNQEAVFFYASRVWPLVVSVMPQAEFVAIGHGCPVHLKESVEKIPGVTIAGYRDDLAAEYAQASVAVAPIFSGGGTSIKVLEAISFGVPCIVSTFAARGLSQLLANYEKNLRANDEEGFAKITLSLLRDPPQREAISLGLSAALEQYFSFSNIQDEVGRVLGLSDTAECP